MTKRNRRETAEEAMLSLFPGSAEFDDRCREAVTIGLTVRRLRDERQADARTRSIGFGGYLNDLARDARIAPAMMREVLEWFSATGTAALRNGAQVARLARGLDMELRELLVRVRVDVAEASAGPLVALARDSSRRPSRIKDYEQLLSRLHWDGDMAKGLQAFDRDVRTAYADGVE